MLPPRRAGPRLADRGGPALRTAEVRLSGGGRQDRADGRAEGPADVERGAGAGCPHLELLRHAAEELPRRPADHRDPRRAYWMPLRDEAARRVDPALSVRRRLAVGPVPRPAAERRLADDLRADRAHHREAVVDL